MWKSVGLGIVCLLGLSSVATAQQDRCHFICDIQLRIEPTLTIEPLASRHRVIVDGVTERVNRERVFEMWSLR